MFQSAFRFLVTNVVNRTRLSLCSVTERSHFGGAFPGNKQSHIQDYSRCSCLLLVSATFPWNLYKDSLKILYGHTNRVPWKFQENSIEIPWILHGDSIELHGVSIEPP